MENKLSRSEPAWKLFIGNFFTSRAISVLKKFEEVARVPAVFKVFELQNALGEIEMSSVSQTNFISVMWYTSKKVPL